MTKVPADATEDAPPAPVPAAAAAEIPGPQGVESVAPGEAPTGEFVIAATDEAPNPWAPGAEQEEEAFVIKKGHMVKDELDMTSLVDVTFLLLVFFMITASFSVQKSLQIAAPESDDAASSSVVVSAEDIAGESVIVEVDAQDRIKVDDVPVSGMAELKTVLASKLATESKTDVLIEAAYQATHGTVVSVTDSAIAVGMQRVRRASRGNDE